MPFGVILGMWHFCHPEWHLRYMQFSWRSCLCHSWRIWLATCWHFVVRIWALAALHSKMDQLQFLQAFGVDMVKGGHIVLQRRAVMQEILLKGPRKREDMKKQIISLLLDLWRLRALPRDALDSMARTIELVVKSMFRQCTLPSIDWKKLVQEAIRQFEAPAGDKENVNYRSRSPPKKILSCVMGTGMIRGLHCKEELIPVQPNQSQWPNLGHVLLWWIQNRKFFAVNPANCLKHQGAHVHLLFRIRMQRLKSHQGNYFHRRTMDMVPCRQTIYRLCPALEPKNLGAHGGDFLHHDMSVAAALAPDAPKSLFQVCTAPCEMAAVWPSWNHKGASAPIYNWDGWGLLGLRVSLLWRHSLGQIVSFLQGNLPRLESTLTSCIGALPSKNWSILRDTKAQKLCLLWPPVWVLRSTITSLHLDASDWMAKWIRKKCWLRMFRRVFPPFDGTQLKKHASALQRHQVDGCQLQDWMAQRHGKCLRIEDACVFDGFGVQGLWDKLNMAVGVRGVPANTAIPWIILTRTQVCIAVWPTGKIQGIARQVFSPLPLQAAARPGRHVWECLVRQRGNKPNFLVKRGPVPTAMDVQGWTAWWLLSLCMWLCGNRCGLLKVQYSFFNQRCWIPWQLFIIAGPICGIWCSWSPAHKMPARWLNNCKGSCSLTSL